MSELFDMTQYSKPETGAVSDWQIDCDGTDEWNSNNLTSARELGQDSPSQESNWEDSSLSDSTKQISGVGKFSENDTPKQRYGEMLGLSQMRENQTSLPPAHPVNPSQFKENDKEQLTKGTVSQQSYEQSLCTDPDTLQLRMSQDSLQQDSDQGKTGYILINSLHSLPPAGTMRNGFVEAADTLPVPSLESDYCWLDSPGGLSSRKSRPPGQSKLESKLKKLGLLQKGEVLNPDFLQRGLGLPPSYLNPSESRTAAQLLEDSGRQQEMLLTPEWQRSPLIESYTLKISRRKKGEGTGHLYSKPIVRKGKKYNQWWYQWVEDGSRKSKYIPKKLLGVVRDLENVKAPVKKILQVLGVNS